MGIGSHPYFSIPSGVRAQARLRIPASKLAVVNNYDDVFPTGQLVEASGPNTISHRRTEKNLGKCFWTTIFRI